MTDFNVKIADRIIAVSANFTTTYDFMKAYHAEGEPDFSISLTPEDIAYERMKSEREDILEGIPVRNFSDAYLETLALQRKIAEELFYYDTLLFHGSVVAVDGAAYLFTAKSGTGKSTHTRLWREMLGDRAVMVNDDKPFLRFVDEWRAESSRPTGGDNEPGEYAAAASGRPTGADVDGCGGNMRDVEDAVPYGCSASRAGASARPTGADVIMAAASGRPTDCRGRTPGRPDCGFAQGVCGDAPVNGGVLVYGSPWNGKHGLGRNICVPLKAICILERGDENSIRAISAKEALPMLIQQSNRPRSAGKMAKYLELVDKLSGGVNFYALRCNMDPDAARVSYEAMAGDDWRK